MVATSRTLTALQLVLTSILLLWCEHLEATLQAHTHSLHSHYYCRAQLLDLGSRLPSC